MTENEIRNKVILEVLDVMRDLDAEIDEERRTNCECDLDSIYYIPSLAYRRIEAMYKK